MKTGNVIANEALNTITKEDGTSVKVMRRTMALLLLFSANIGFMYTRENILIAIWGTSTYCNGRSMDVYITHLRNALKGTNLVIVNAKGIGYKFLINTHG